MTDLDQKVEAAFARYALAARVPAASKRDEDMYLVAERRALEAAIAERATAPLVEVLESAVNDLDPANNFGDLRQPMSMVRNYLRAALAAHKEGR